jgi:ribonuclease BN (tRNA processing enzyme)
VELTVLGKSPAMPDADGANSGYLLRHQGYTLLVDCGSGVFSKLRALADPLEVDAVLITHLHADHTTDLIPFSHALNYPYAHHGKRPALWGPPGSQKGFATLCGIYGAESQIEQAFEFAEYNGDATLDMGPFEIRLGAVPHYVPTWACDFRAGDGGRITFGADCGPNDAIVELARGTDLLMLEATEGPQALGHEPSSGNEFRGHLSAQEAGELARRAGAKRLLLTHYSDELDASELRSAAHASFGADVELATEGARFTP